ncbi:methyltransferase [Actinokineospora terrae]|uniref:Dimerisation domain-containing protein n=1 Tax=Actinokineospora terrae TaxID=155974 RepID=A0A1H9WJ30_9PSEU|nr:methyltransferase [Actinokineospora terrae]SES33739.1 Dimerisation domain-containing protein [Actinokineospora terrae]
MSDATTAQRELIELLTGFWRSQSLYVATELGIIDRLDPLRPTAAAEVALSLGFDTDAVTRLLGYLGSVGVLAGDEATGYTLTEVGALARTDAVGTMRDHITLYGNQFYRAWGELAHSIRHGGSSFAQVHGADLFTHLKANPDLSHAYERMMVAGAPFFTAVAEAFDFSAASLVVDVAGGHGALLEHVLRATPGLRAVLFDTPHVIAEAARHPIAELGDRCERVGGDFFACVPEGGDVYVLSRILHCFDDEACHRILTTIRSAIAPGGSLLVLERLTGADASPLSHGFNMHMLVVLGGGRERDEPHYRDMLDKAGFTLGAVHPLPLDTRLLVASPRQP